MDSLVELFCELVTIPSPSGRELAVARYIQSYLKKHGIDARFDSTGTQNDSNANNLIVRLPGDARLPTLLFVAHMDTVETGEKPVKPLVSEGTIRSDGTTILGADDKASVACLMEMLTEMKDVDWRPTIVTVFTTREEEGRMGSSLLDLPDKIDACFNLDGPNNLGDFAYQMLGVVPFAITIIGRAAHAAVEPEKGANALIAAAQIVTSLPIGKDADNVVLNIGTLQGGTADNVVPDRALIHGHVRAYTQEALEACLQKVVSAAKIACQKTGCEYEFSTSPEEGAPPAMLPPGHAVVDIARAATEAAGAPFSLIKLSGTSDANFLAARYPTLTICRGSKDPHAFNEEIGVQELIGLKKLVLAVIRQVSDQPKA